MDRRRDLLGQIDGFRRQVEQSGTLETWDKLSQQAYDLVTSGRARDAFDLSKEPDALRDRYGRHGWGQSVLLARRLVEAGVRLVHVNWPREPGDSAVDNPLWDTHAQNADRLQDVLCPQFDVTFPALIDDLESRGLLDETLVVAIGEFGRTPKINRLGGRDHWGHVFSFAMAGAGIAGGQVFGSSDKNGAYPGDRPDPPARPDGDDLPPAGHRPHRLLPRQGRSAPPAHPGRADRPDPGHRPRDDRKDRARRRPGVRPAVRHPALARHRFPLRQGADLPLLRRRARRAGGHPRSLGPDAGAGSAAAGRAGRAAFGKHGGEAGCRGRNGPIGGGELVRGSRAILAQEIRNARGGHYTFTIRATGGGESREVFESVFGESLKCRLVLFRFADMSKNPGHIEELASVDFRPEFLEAAESETPRAFTLSRFLGATVPGQNFATGNGLGVAIVLEALKDLPRPPDAGEPRRLSAFLQVHDVSLAFNAAAAR